MGGGGGSGSFRLARCQAQAGQERLSVLGVATRRIARHDERGDRNRATRACFVEPPHMGIARGKSAVLLAKEGSALLDGVFADRSCPAAHCRSRTAAGSSARDRATRPRFLLLSRHSRPGLAPHDIDPPAFRHAGAFRHPHHQRRQGQAGGRARHRRPAPQPGWPRAWRRVVGVRRRSWRDLGGAQYPAGIPDDDDRVRRATFCARAPRGGSPASSPRYMSAGGPSSCRPRSIAPTGSSPS